MNPYFRMPRGAEPAAESMTPEERRFAEAVLGKVIRTERETLEWVAQFSERHAVELRRLREAEADAQRDQASGGQPPAGAFSLFGIVRESGVWATHPPRSLEEFEAWNQAQLVALRELEAEVRAAGNRRRPQRDFEIAEASWDAAKHPRLGASPNAGWFASTGAGGKGGSVGDQTWRPSDSPGDSGRTWSKPEFQFDPGAAMSRGSLPSRADGPAQSAAKPSPFAANESERAATKIANRSGNHWSGDRFLGLADAIAPSWASFIRQHFTLSVASSGATEPTITIRSGESGPDINKDPATAGAAPPGSTVHIEIPADWNDFQVLQYVLSQIADHGDVNSLATKWAAGKPELVQQIRDQRFRNGLSTVATLAGSYYTALAGLAPGGQAAVVGWDIQNGDNLGAALGVACMLPLGEILEAGLKAGGVLAIKAGEKLLAILPASVIERLGKLAADQRALLGKRLLTAKTEGEAAEIIEKFLGTPFDRHHPLAKFLAGNTDQLLATIPREVHHEFEVLLRRELKAAGLNTPVGTVKGTKEIWAKFFEENAGAQGTAFEAVLKAARQIDAKHGTEITQRVWENLIGKNFMPLPKPKP